MEVVGAVLQWFTDPVNWQGADGVPNRILEHIGYFIGATGLALLIALPVGLLVGHTGKGGTLAINLSNVGRAVPSFGIIILAFILLGIGLLPPLIALTAMAIPPIVTNTYVGVQSVDPDVRDSAEGMGLTGMQVLRDVEVPVAMPLIMAGVRTSSVQVVATATLAAFIGLGGLGRYIFDALQTQDTAEVVAGAILVAILALIVEFAMSRLQQTIVSTGLQQRNAEAAVDAKVAGPVG
ncbi:MAG: ABC transporter permease [Actinobacteria bacterium]|nr:ABC transporter permease [Actinomycetota bacterium]